MKMFKFGVVGFATLAILTSCQKANVDQKKPFLQNHIQFQTQIKLNAKDSLFILKKQGENYYYKSLSESGNTDDSIVIMQFGEKTSSTIKLESTDGKPQLLDFAVNERSIYTLLKSAKDGDSLKIARYDKRGAGAYEFKYISCVAPDSNKFNAIDIYAGGVAIYAKTFGKLFDSPRFMALDNNLKFQVAIIWPIPPGANLSYDQPRKLIGVYGDRFYYSQATNYVIYFCKKGVGTYSMIDYQPPYFNKDRNILGEIDTISSIDALKANIDKFRKTPSIISVNMLNEDNVLVCRNNADSIFYDYWKYNGKEWKIQQEGLKDYQLAKIVSETNKVGANPMFAFGRKFLVLDGNIILMKALSLDLKSKEIQDLTLQAFDKKCSDNLASNLFYSLLAYKPNFK
jgi:hypothetical protein